MGLKGDIARLGNRIAPKAWLSLEIARRNPHFEREYWLLPQLCCRDADSVDVGGNTGVYAYYLSQLTRNVHVFEPNPSCLSQLAKIKRRNMTFYPVALSDRRGQATMRFDPGNEGVGTIEEANRLDQNPGIRSVVERQVEVRLLDDFDLQNVGFMKIDVEGHEPAVLRGAKRLLRTQSPVILIEIERRHNPTAFEEVEGLTAEWGYTAWRLADRRLVPVSRKEIDQLQILPVSGGCAYINNFIYIPPDRATLAAEVHL